MHPRNRECCSRDSQRLGFPVHGLLLCKFKETEPKCRLCQKENIIAPVISTLNYPTNRLSPSKGESQFTDTQALIVWASAAQEGISVSIKSQWSHKLCHSFLPAIPISPSRWKTRSPQTLCELGHVFFFRLNVHLLNSKRGAQDSVSYRLPHSICTIHWAQSQELRSPDH